jgi:cytochrome c-type biogenesis protein CcmH/NrfG
VAVLIKYIELLERQGRNNQVTQLLERMPDLEVLTPHRWKNLAAQKKYDEAIAELEKQLARNPNDAAARVLMARLVYLRDPRDFDKAMKLLDEAQKLAPNLLAVVSTRVILLHQAGRNDEALAVLNAEVQRRNDFSAYLLRAEYLAAEQRFEAAEKDYQHLTTFPTSAAEGYLRLGTFYERTRESGYREKAIAAYEAGYQAEPKSGDLKRSLTRALLSSDDAAHRQRGQKLLDELVAHLKLHGEDPSVIFIQAEALLHDGSLNSRQKAMDLFEKVTKLDRRNVAAYLQLIKFASAQGDLARASQIAAAALGANPDNTDLLLVRASIESDLGNLIGARELANSVLDKEPEHIAALNLMANLSLQVGEIDKAERYNDRLLKRAPEFEDGRVVQARILESRDQKAKAIEVLEAYRATPKGAKSVNVALRLADLYRKQRDYARCDERLQQVERAAPEMFEAFSIRLQALAEQQKFDELFKLLEARLTSRSEAQALVAAAAILSDVNATAQLERAKPLFRSFLSKDPGSINGHLALAVLAYRTLDMKGALDAYQAVLKLDPYHLKSLNNVAWIYSEEMGRYDEALSYANTGVLRYPADPNLLNTRGVILFRKSELDKAKLDLRRSVELPNVSPGTKARSLLFLAQIAKRESDIRPARQLATQALEIDDKSKVLTVQERADAEQLAGRRQPETRAAVP